MDTGNFDEAEPAFSPDGKTLAFVSNQHLPESTDLWIIPVQGGKAKQAASFSTPSIASEPE